jgi:hypothetical protein
VVDADFKATLTVKCCRGARRGKDTEGLTAESSGIGDVAIEFEQHCGTLWT